MRRTAVIALLAASVAGGLARPAYAQVRIGAAGGPVAPLGEFADAAQTGFHGGAVVEVGIPLLPLGVRLDAMFQRFPGEGTAPALTDFFATANARLGVLPIPLLSAYLTAGVGAYSSEYRRDPAVTGRATSPGVNAGLGGSVNLIVVRPFAEVRFHRVLGDDARSFVPVTVGVFF